MVLFEMDLCHLIPFSYQFLLDKLLDRSNHFDNEMLLHLFEVFLFLLFLLPTIYYLQAILELFNFKSSKLKALVYHLMNIIALPILFYCDFLYSFLLYL